MIASREARSADEVRRHDTAIARVMTDIAADPWVLCEVVGRGPLQWRSAFVDAMHSAGLPLATDEIADRLFAFFCLQLQKLAHSDDRPQTLARHYLDHMEVEEPPHIPTEREIADSWELESASSDEGQRFAYGGKTKDEVLRSFEGEMAGSTFEHE
jgi:hypothetical protein